MPEKKGLSGQHHGELNRPDIVFPGGEEGKATRIAQLRQEYDGDTKALQQIDVYEGNNEYSRHLNSYIEAIKGGNLSKQKELEEWFHLNYPDLNS